MDIRKGISSILEEYGISIRGLSERSGVRRQSIANFLNGGNIHIKNLEKMLSAIGYEMVISRGKADPSFLEERLKFRRKDIAGFCKENDISYLAVFGSATRGDFGRKSDVDIIVKFKKPVSFFELSEIERGLGKIIKGGHRLDLVTINSVSPLLADEIKGTSEVIYEEAA